MLQTAIHIPVVGIYAKIKSLTANGEFCCLLKTFANSLDADQARKNVGPNLVPSCLTLMILLKAFSDFFKKNSRQKTKKHAKSLSRQQVKKLCGYQI